VKICLIEPFFTGSHAAWAEEYARFSHHQVQILSLKGRNWKWRMHGGAVTLAQEFLRTADHPDLLLTTDMLDLTSFLALTRKKSADLPVALYFHENQLTYPWSPTDADPGHKRDAHYAFINYTSALAADRILFNSRYHLNSFIDALPNFLRSFPDHREEQGLPALRDKCRHLSLGLDLRRLDPYRPQKPRHPQSPPLILWNHRWEYDKNPQSFFEALFLLHQEGYDFEVAILGESYRKAPAIFTEARQRLGKRVVQFGYAKDFASYAHWLWRANILPVTSHHDFFGASVVQAIYCGCTPLLPRRLAYAEHLPPAFQSACLYEDFDDLLQRLRQLLGNPLAAPAELREHVTRYDWQRLAPDYDNRFHKLLSC
jgi:glycosyltransferase involved in cell wall biosynthesis